MHRWRHWKSEPTWYRMLDLHGGPSIDMRRMDENVQVVKVTALNRPMRFQTSQVYRFHPFHFGNSCRCCYTTLWIEFSYWSSPFGYFFLEWLAVALCGFSPLRRWRCTKWIPHQVGRKIDVTPSRPRKTEKEKIQIGQCQVLAADAYSESCRKSYAPNRKILANT